MAMSSPGLRDFRLAATAIPAAPPPMMTTSKLASARSVGVLPPFAIPRTPLRLGGDCLFDPVGAAFAGLGLALAVRGARREAPRPGQVDKMWIRFQHAQHVLGVRLPVGRRVKHAARFEYARQRMQKIGLDDTAFVVSFLGPGIGEKQLQPVQTMLR